VLEPERVALDVLAVDELEELRPKLALQRRRGLVLELRPERLQGRRGAPIGDRILAQLQPDRERVWRQLLLERHRAIEPGKEELGLLGIELRLLQLGERAARQLEDGPAQPVAGDADEAGALLALAIGQVVRHPPGDILPFLDEIALRLEDGAADEGVETSPYLRHAPLEIERAALGAGTPRSAARGSRP
jgi:hypothetical protein